MKRKHILLTVAACLLLLAGILGWQLLSSYNLTLRLNWGISIPFWARPTQCYEKDSGPSFLGDGIRYHIFSYQYEDFIDQMFAWGSVDRETIYCDSLTQAAETWLDEIEVPAEYRPDYDACCSKGLCGEKRDKADASGTYYRDCLSELHASKITCMKSYRKRLDKSAFRIAHVIGNPECEGCGMYHIL